MYWNLGSQSALKSICCDTVPVNPGATGSWSAVAYVLSAVPYGPVITIGDAVNSSNLCPLTNPEPEPILSGAIVLNCKCAVVNFLMFALFFLRSSNACLDILTTGLANLYLGLLIICILPNTAPAGWLP